MVFLATSSGCWSRKEVERLSIVTALGFDKVEVGGQEKWRVTVQVIRPGELRGGTMRGGGGAGGRKPLWLASAIGDTLLDAGRNLSTRSPRLVFLAHADIIVLGERLAREGAREVTDFLLRDPRIRLRDWILVTPGEALEALRAEPELEKLPSQEIMGQLTVNWKRVSKAQAINLKDFANQLATTGRDTVASRIEVFTPTEERPAGGGAVGAPQKTMRLAGAAVFKKDRLVGWMGDRETRGYLYVIGKLEGGILALSTHGKKKDASISLTKSRSKITPRVRDGRISVTVDIKAEGDLGEHEELKSIASPKEMKPLEEIMAREIKNMVENTIRLAQEEFGSDIFGFGESLHRKYPRVWKEVKKDWDQIFPTLEVTVNVKARVRRTGMIGDSPIFR